MAKVHSRGNKSTEGKVEGVLLAEGISGWEKHPKLDVGKPDFYFPGLRLAVFVDGCFWHACPHCNRNTPCTRRDFWREKIESNRKRDNRIRRKMRADGYHVMRIWEHEIKSDRWLKRLTAMIRKYAPNGAPVTDRLDDQRPAA